MSEEKKRERFFKEGNYEFPKYKRDPNGERFKAAFARAVAERGLSDDLIELNRIACEGTYEERRILRCLLPLRPRLAVYWKKRMGKEAFLAEGFNLDYTNEELGPDWMDKY